MSVQILFMLSIIVLLTLLVFYSLIKLKKEQERNIKRLELESGRKYLELADLLPQVVFETDYEGKLTFLNNNGKEILGISRIDLLNGINIKSLPVEAHRERFFEDYLYIREGGLNKGQEYIIQGGNGQKLPMIFFMSAINEDGRIKGLRGIAFDTTEQKKLERKILSTVIETEDRERQRFAEDLHDGLGPLLSTIKLYVDQLHTSQISADDREKLLNATYELLEESIVTTRSIANNILPGTISDNGLVAAVNTFCHKVQSTGAIAIDFKTNLDKRLNAKLEKTLYRIIIELINNTLKHANAQLITLEIDVDGRDLFIYYQDDGEGFDMRQESQGMGLINIANRCKSIFSEYRMETAPGKGFKMVISLNLKS